jgi:hypothetical protein
MRLAIAGLLGSLLLILLASLALAQEPAPVETPGVTTITRIPPVPDAHQLIWFVIVTLLFALGALAVVFFYTYKIQSRFYEASEGLGRLGRAVNATATAAFVAPAGRLEGMGEATPAALHVTGPGVVTVGVESDEFTAAFPEGSPADAATWTVTPNTAATVRRVAPNSGARVKVIAAVNGAFTLRADVTTPSAAQGEVSVAAVAPQSNRIELPFVGSGYGTIAVAIILVAAVIVLGLAGVLSSESIAPLLAALLGYIFGATASAAGRSGEGATRG